MVADTNRVTRGVKRTSASFWGVISVGSVVLVLLWWWLPVFPAGTSILVAAPLTAVHIWLKCSEDERSTAHGNSPSA